jgi:tetratricopeptide (TPR) repeat protein
LTGLLSAIVVFYSYITYNRNFTWKSDVPFLTDIIEKNPPVGYIYRAYGNRGVAYMKSGMLPEALLDYNASIKLNPDDSRTYYNRALVYFNQQQYALSLTDLNKAISMDAKQPLLYNDRGQARLLLKDTTGAVADLYKCLELDSTFSDAYNSLATIEFAKGNFDASEKLLTKAIYFNPAFSIAIKNRGLVYLQVNRKADACNDFQNASYLNNEEAKSLFQQYCR